MSKPKITRLKRLESLVEQVATTPVTLSKYKQIIEWLRTSVATAQTINVPAATGKSG